MKMLRDKILLQIEVQWNLEQFKQKAWMDLRSQNRKNIILIATLHCPRTMVASTSFERPYPVQ